MKDFDKKSSKLTKMPILIVFCNFFEIIIIRQLKSNKTFFIFNLFDLLNLTNFQKKTSRGQIGRVCSNRVGSKMIPVSRVHQTEQSEQLISSEPKILENSGQDGHNLFGLRRILSVINRQWVDLTWFAEVQFGPVWISVEWLIYGMWD